MKWNPTNRLSLHILHRSLLRSMPSVTEPYTDKQLARELSEKQWEVQFLHLNFDYPGYDSWVQYHGYVSIITSCVWKKLQKKSGLGSSVRTWKSIQWFVSFPAHWRVALSIIILVKKESKYEDLCNSDWMDPNDHRWFAISRVYLPRTRPDTGENISKSLRTATGIWHAISPRRAQSITSFPCEQMVTIFACFLKKTRNLWFSWNEHVEVSFPN